MLWFRKILFFLASKIPSFTYLNLTQFLGALNDNIYKFLITYFLIRLVGVDNAPKIMSYVGAVFVLPFLLFSAISGNVADRFSKSQIIVLTKILEVVTMSLGFLGFWLDWEFGSYLILFLMATQSALFSPCKYGILPEIVPNEKISRANGMMSAFTYLAIILGTFLATWVTDITDYNFVAASLLCILIALVGLGTSFFIEYTQPADEEKRITLRIVSDIYRTFRRIWREVPAPMVLLTAMFSSAYFLFLGSFMQLNLIPYAVQVLSLSEIQGGYLFLYTALGIGLGSYIAGRISGASVELGLVPLAGLGLCIGCFLLDFLSDWPRFIPPLVFLLGLSGGLFLVPLDATIQVNSPSNIRGQVVAATNFLSFLGVLLAAVALFVMGPILDLRADFGFTVIGFITLAYVSFLSYQFFDFFTRFLGMCLCRLHFRLTCEGREKLPSEGPAIFVCYHHAWNDTLLLLGAQRGRVRFLVEEEKPHSSWMKRFYRLFRVRQLSSQEHVSDQPLALQRIKDTLHKGISVCIFVADPDVEGAIERLKSSFAFQDLLDEYQVPLIAVHLDKTVSEPKNTDLLSRWINKFSWPAKVIFS